MLLALIPARGGSKGLPRKNIRNLCGKPLIAWSIEAALSSSLIDRVVVSTEDIEIANVAKMFGAEISMRSPELALDDTTTISVVNSIAKEYSEYNDFVILQPTSPLRNPGMIDKCIEVYKGGGYSNLATGFMCKSAEYGSHNNLRRQDTEGFFYDDGNVYILSRTLALDMQWCGNHPCKFKTSREENYEIDDEIDLLILDALMKNRSMR